MAFGVFWFLFVMGLSFALGYGIGQLKLLYDFHCFLEKFDKNK